MPKEIFRGYDISYIRDLLAVVGKDVQSNEQCFDDDYMCAISSACEKFNMDFEDTFDDGDGKE